MGQSQALNCELEFESKPIENNGEADFADAIRIADNGMGSVPNNFFDSNSSCTCCVSQYEEVSSTFESLHYSPSSFEVTSTLDIERSPARYAKVSKVRYGCHRRGRLWEAWQQEAITGQVVTLVCPFPALNVDKIPATYFLDSALTELTVISTKLGESMVVTILIDSIQLICPALSYTPLVNDVNRLLNAAERKQAILVQYTTDVTEWHHLCFIEETVQKKDRCIQALTALLLERRLNEGMTF